MGVYDFMTQRLFALQHHISLGCQEPRCHYIYTKDEIQNDDMETYLVNHKYHNDLLDVHQLELKIWKLDEIININPICPRGWTPSFFLYDNGFNFEKKIDLFNLFGTPHKPNQHFDDLHDLSKKIHELELEKEKIRIAMDVYPDKYSQYIESLKQQLEQKENSIRRRSLPRQPARVLEST